MYYLVGGLIYIIIYYPQERKKILTVYKKTHILGKSVSKKIKPWIL